MWNHELVTWNFEHLKFEMGECDMGGWRNANVCTRVCGLFPELLQKQSLDGFNNSVIFIGLPLYSSITWEEEMQIVILSADIDVHLSNCRIKLCDPIP